MNAMISRRSIRISILVCVLIAALASTARAVTCQQWMNACTDRCWDAWTLDCQLACQSRAKQCSDGMCDFESTEAGALLVDCFDVQMTKPEEREKSVVVRTPTTAPCRKKRVSGTALVNAVR